MLSSSKTASNDKSNQHFWKSQNKFNPKLAGNSET